MPPSSRSARRLAAAAVLAVLAVLAVPVARASPSEASAGGRTLVSVGGTAAGYAEPTFALSPDGRTLVGGAIGYRPAGRGDVAGIDALRSTDGGATWREQALPTPGFLAGYDPSVAFSGSSNVVLGEVASEASGCVTGGSIVIRRSGDSGATWGPPEILDDNRSGPLFDDKPRVTADPSTGRVWAAWSQASTASADPCAGMPARNRLLLARSQDGGRTFSAPVRLRAPGFPTAFGAWPALGPDGDLYVAYEGVDQAAVPERAAILVSVSRNGGATFGRPVRVGSVVQPEPPPGANVYAVAWPTLAVDPTTGRVWVAWADGRGGGARVLVASADPNLRRFSRPATLRGAAGLGPQLLPAFGAGPSPVLGFLGFGGGLRPYIATLGLRGFRRPVAAAPPGAVASPFQLGEYLGAGAVGGRAAVMWPGVGEGGQLLWFVRTATLVHALPSPTPSRSVSPPPRSGSAGAGPRPDGGGPGAGAVALAALAVVAVLVAALAAARRAGARRSRRGSGLRSPRRSR